MDTFRSFVANLSRAQIGDTVNQYSCHVAGVDREGGAAIRQANLLQYLESRRGASLLLLGEAPSYQGCRFSGIPFTSERRLAPEHRSSVRPEGWTEPSSTIVHRVLGELGIEDDVLLWNTCPLHPSGSKGPLSNRTPTRVELKEGLRWLDGLRGLLTPSARIVAVGKSAEHSLPAMLSIRHPAYGGATRFSEGLRQLVRETGK